MITTITPLRRVAVTLVLTGATAFGAIGIAPAAFADETTTVTESAPVTAAAPEVVVPEVVVPEVVVPEVVVPATPPVVEAPPAAPAPVVEPAPAPAPVVTPPPVVVGKDGKPVKQPKVCTTKDLTDLATKVAKATAQAAPLTSAAAKLREASAALRAQAAKLTASQARIAQALAGVSDFAAAKLEDQAKALIAKANTVDCIVVSAPGGRF
jgi:hypothetical protein